LLEREHIVKPRHLLHTEPQTRHNTPCPTARSSRRPRSNRYRACPSHSTPALTHSRNPRGSCSSVLDTSSASAGPNSGDRPLHRAVPQHQIQTRDDEKLGLQDRGTTSPGHSTVARHAPQQREELKRTGNRLKPRDDRPRRCHPLWTRRPRGTHPRSCRRNRRRSTCLDQPSPWRATPRSTASRLRQADGGSRGRRAGEDAVVVYQVPKRCRPGLSHSRVWRSSMRACRAVEKARYFMCDAWYSQQPRGSTCAPRIPIQRSR
jgi:hypothetical protein